MSNTPVHRARWAAIGAAVAISIAAGGISIVSAAVSSGERLVYVPVDQCRIMDTRAANQVGPRGTPIGDGETYAVAAHGTAGDCVIPTDAQALSLNVTAVRASASTFLTFWDGSLPRPDTSNLNPVPGAPPTPNAVSVELSDTGEFSLYNEDGTVEVLADVNGYYADHDHDDRYLLADEIITSYGPGGWIASTIVNPPPSINYEPDLTKVDVNGAVGRVFMPLAAPMQFGATPDDVAYRASKIEVCADSFAGTAVIDEISVIEHEGVLFADATDRSSDGCYELDMSATPGGARSYTVVVDVKGSGHVFLLSVTATWIPDV